MRLIGLAVLLIVGLGLMPPAEAQQPSKIPRLGYLVLAPLSETPSPERAAFLAGLRELGWIEGKTITIEYRSAKSNIELLDDLATELVRTKVDIIVAAGPDPLIRAAKQATSTIPIVMTGGSDPVAERFVANDAARLGRADRAARCPLGSGLLPPDRRGDEEAGRQKDNNEEVVKSLQEVNAIRREGPRYVLNWRLREVVIPDTIQNVIMARCLRPLIDGKERLMGRGPKNAQRVKPSPTACSALVAQSDGQPENRERHNTPTGSTRRPR